eukprot:764927-Hanusia_phi.AAC.2
MAAFPTLCANSQPPLQLGASTTPSRSQQQRQRSPYLEERLLGVGWVHQRKATSQVLTQSKAGNTRSVQQRCAFSEARKEHNSTGPEKRPHSQIHFLPSSTAVRESHQERSRCTTADRIGLNVFM